LSSPDEDSSLRSPEERNAFAFILAKLGRRDHTEKELRQGLARKGFEEDASEKALERARREGLVNDERLAGTLARTSARSGRRGPLRVLAALRNKGVASETARAATKAAFEGADETDPNLARFATNLLRRAKGETKKDRRLKVLRSLVARGFPMSLAGRVVRFAENALEDENKGL
jgi:regulatory protein